MAENVTLTAVCAGKGSGGHRGNRAGLIGDASETDSADGPDEAKAAGGLASSAGRALLDDLRSGSFASVTATAQRLGTGEPIDVSLAVAALGVSGAVGQGDLAALRLASSGRRGPA